MEAGGIAHPSEKKGGRDAGYLVCGAGPLKIYAGEGWPTPILPNFLFLLSPQALPISSPQVAYSNCCDENENDFYLNLTERQDCNLIKCLLVDKQVKRRRQDCRRKSTIMTIIVLYNVFEEGSLFVMSLFVFLWPD